MDLDLNWYIKQQEEEKEMSHKMGDKIRRRRDRPRILEQRKKRKKDQKKQEKIIAKAFVEFAQIIANTMEDLKKLEEENV